ncbi:hypothetical protein QEV67_04335 [Trueperella pyogenes]|uniref:hypothetical protein n=1 Tax=Trueperella pyogenes TaxID=1661 RepID=UPI00324306DE
MNSDVSQWVEELTELLEAPPIIDPEPESTEPALPPPVITPPPLPKAKTTVVDLATEVLDALTSPEAS